MGNQDLTHGANTEYSSIAAHTVDTVIQDGVTDQDETYWQNTEWPTQWSMFNSIPKLKNAIVMKAIWNIGKGYTADNYTMVRLAHIQGYGKQTFKQILFNMDIVRMIGGDAYAEIVRDDKTGTIVNLKILSPENIRIVRDRSGMLIRYEQTNKVKGSKPKVFLPEQIFHMSYNVLADQFHGTSVIKSLEKQILADDKLFDNIDRLVKYQLMPFIIFKVKDDDETLIADLRTKIKKSRQDGEDFVLPDDDNILSWEVVEVNPSSMILEWRTELRNEFYRAVGLPQIIPGASGQGTESDGKVIYTAFEQIVWSDQIDWEEQIWAQLSLRINLIHPASLLQDLQTDQQKDANQGLDAQDGMNGS